MIHGLEQGTEHPGIISYSLTKSLCDLDQIFPAFGPLFRRGPKYILNSEHVNARATLRRPFKQMRVLPGE